MRRIYKLYYLFPALLAMLVLQTMTACQEDSLIPEAQLPGDGLLRFQGVNAQQVVVKTRAERKGFFPLGTHYRIWAYGDENGGENRTLRFNACGVETENGNSRLILMPEETELSFRNVDKDIIDFYGLTDPLAKDIENPETYLEAVGTDNPVYTLRYGEGKEIPDLRYAVKTGNTSQNTGYILPLEFRHILSKVTFEVVQQADEADNESGKFKDIYLEKIEVLSRPGSGDFDIKKGSFTQLDDNKDFTLSPQESGILIGTVPSKADSILLFPTAETEKDPMQVKISLRGAEGTFNDFENQEGYETADNGARLTVTCPVYDSYKTEGGKPVPLRLLPNYRYVLQFMIMGNDVHIVTVLPRVYEWLDGETDNTDADGNGYEEQDLGQPATFGGVVWSDRNLGANSAHPLTSLEEWRKSVGYFYQFNRNIPYFPNTYTSKVDVNLNTPLEEALWEDATLKDDKGNEIGFRNLYPVVNYRAWDLSYVRPGKNWYPPANSGPLGEAIKPMGGRPHNSYVYTIGQKDAVPSYEEGAEKNNIIRFGINLSFTGNQGSSNLPLVAPGKRWLWRDENGMKGEQPCPQGWSIPTEEQFKSIIPTSGYAGNITFRKYVKKNNDGGWHTTSNNDFNQFREHDFPEIFKKGGEGLVYKNIPEKTPGQAMIDKDGKEWAYLGEFPCLFREEKDDPQVGAKSQYVLSMYGDDWTRVQDESPNLREKDKDINYVYNWGVIYGIKNQGTSNAYRVKWEVKVVGNSTVVNDLSEAKKFCENPSTTMYEGKTARRYEHLYCYLVISRYPATVTDDLSPDENGSCEWVAKDRDWWSNPSEELYLPIGGVAGQFRSGKLYNIGTEVRYGLVDESTETFRDIPGSYKRCIWLKIAGGSTTSLGLFLENSYTSDLISIRPVRD